MAETTGAYDTGFLADLLKSPDTSSEGGTVSGILAGTRVATSVGWQLIENIREGDAVLTFDNGLRKVRAIKRTRLWEGDGLCPRQFQPFCVPAGALGNREEMLVLPRQGVLVESDAAENALGDPFVLVQVSALAGTCDIARRAPDAPIEVLTLHFDEDEIVFSSNGALCICPAVGDMLQRVFRITREETAEYRMLTTDTSAALIEDIAWELEEKWAMTLNGRRTRR
ncbi:Hint domain-containing protein [Pseudooceanicola aestuarii]|uniref:Hint domain-containing protein n=1 Tax=Pseudooceanicola aestuarii TaxID=2697319 RepID=UPI0013D86C3D|nr:Hint domain-containing protein [Pseudooceanicola aestuarii]